MRPRPRLMPLVVLLVMASSPRVCARGSCIDYGDYTRWVGSVDVGSARGVAISSPYAYVVTGDSSLVVVDISHPAVPHLVRSTDIPGAGPLVVSGSLAYVAAGPGLHIFDISDPGFPSPAGSVGFPGSGSATDVEVSGSMAYAATADSGFLIVDVTDPADPRIVGSRKLEAFARRLALSGSTLWVAGSGGLFIFDVTVPASPELLGIIKEGIYVTDVAIQGTIAYFTASGALWMYDIADPADPVLLGMIPAVGGVATTLAVSGSHAYVSGLLKDLQVIDVSDPATASIAGLVGVHALDIRIDGVHAYAATRSGLHVIDITNQELPAIIGQLPATLSQDVDVSGTLACLAEQANGLRLVDLSDPTSPATVKQLDMPGPAYGVTLSGSHAFVAGGTALHIVDVTDPATAHLVASVGVTGDASDVDVSGSHAYVAEGDSVSVVEIADPVSSRVVGRVAARARWVAASGPYVFAVSDSSSDLMVLDVGNPAQPRVLAGMPLPEPGYAVTAAGSHAYVGGGTSIHVVDLTNPASPFLVRSVALPGLDRRVFALEVSGALLYVANRAGGLFVLDVTEPASTRVVGGAGLSIRSQSLAVADSCVLVTGNAVSAVSALLLVLPSQCSATTPVRLARLEAVSRPGAILLEWATSSERDFSGFHVHRSGEPEGGYVRRTAHPIGPSESYRFLDSGLSPGTAFFYRLEAIDRSGRREWFGPVSARAGSGGRAVAAEALGRAFPNPMTRSTAIPLVLEQDGRVRLHILDVSGRLVRTLVDDFLPAGSREIGWDGRDARGHTAPSGVYLYRLEFDGGRVSRRLVKLP